MLGARLIVLPIVLPWTFSLIAGLPIEAADQPAPPGAASSEKVTAQSTERKKEAASPAPSSAQKSPIGKAATPARTAKPQTPSKAASPVAKIQDQTAPSAKSPSILQMLEGHETELTLAAAIAAAFFLIGWICGGNYYLRRDRLRRRKIRF